MAVGDRPEIGSPVVRTLRTTDDGTYQIAAYTVEEQHCVDVFVQCFGLDEATQVSFKAYWNTAIGRRATGSSVVVDESVPPLSDEGTLGSVDINASGNDVQVEVTGAAATNIRWVCVMTIIDAEVVVVLPA